MAKKSECVGISQTYFTNGKKIGELIERAGGYRMVGPLVGLGTQTLRNYANGCSASKWPAKADLLERLACHFGVCLDELVLEESSGSRDCRAVAKLRPNCLSGEWRVVTTEIVARGCLRKPRIWSAHLCVEHEGDTINATERDKDDDETSVWGELSEGELFLNYAIDTYDTLKQVSLRGQSLGQVVQRENRLEIIGATHGKDPLRKETLRTELRMYRIGNA